MIPGPEDHAAVCDELFVYGTLRRGLELHHHLERLGARFVAEAKIAAKLAGRGRYPGARPAGRKGTWVRGELFHLRQPVRDLRVLDKVEGYIPRAPAHCKFVRAVTELVLNNGARRHSWVYWLGAGNSTGVANG